jgi:hypothetical protein
MQSLVCTHFTDYVLTSVVFIFYQAALAWELSGRHYEKNKEPDFDKALSLYKQAEKCYKEWGSPKKVTQMKEAVSMIITEGKGQQQIEEKCNIY